MMNYRTLCALALATGLAACSQEAADPLPQQPAAVAPAAAAVAPVQAVEKAANVDFVVDPGSLKVCEADNGGVAATVKWNVAGGRPAGVAIYVMDAQGGRKLWLKGGASGQATTDAWVSPGTSFVLQEADTDKALAVVQVQAVACE